jgi:FkbM family methyltransferase
MLKDTFAWIRKKLAKQFNPLLKLEFVTGDFFCKIFNLIRFTSGDSGRISFCKKTGFYKAGDESFYIYFCEKGRARFYKNGPEERIYQLGNSYFLDSIDFEEEDIVIDCGANIGEIFNYFKLKGYNVDYLGFEPSPREFDCLEINTHGKTVHNIGLWHEKGSLDFYISSKGADSSIIKPKTYSHVKKIQTSRFDEIFKRTNEHRIKLLKLEAEGAEPEVLIGFGDLLGKTDYIAADLGYERGINEESTFIPVVNYLLERGFELVEFNNKKMIALFRRKNTTSA